MTSFDSMLSEAELFGTEAVEKAYREIRNRWDNNAKYLTELTVLLNENIRQNLHNYLSLCKKYGIYNNVVYSS